jgi:protein-L-isoaspartate(D-aspartate) O-methyltransferase
MTTAVPDAARPEPATAAGASPGAATARARRAMIDSQLRTSGVNEEYVLARMLAVPREDFLPAHKAPFAYIDRAVALEDGGHLAAPLFYGKLLVEAAPARSDRVLVVGGGTGYLAALIAPLVAETRSVTAAEAVSGAAGREGGFTLVVIDGAVETVPDGLAAQLADDGRMVAGLLQRQVTRLAVGRRIAGRIALQPLEDIGIPVLHAFDAPKGWTF